MDELYVSNLMAKVVDGKVKRPIYMDSETESKAVNGVTYIW